MKKFSFVKQFDAMDCGPACVSMVAQYYGKVYPMQKIREMCFCTREGVSLLGISNAVEAIGMRSQGVRLNYEQLSKQTNLPCIAHWKQRHFIVVYKIRNNKVYVADPAYGLISYTTEDFLKGWNNSRNGEAEQGICLLLEPTPDFYRMEDEKADKRGFSFLLSYLRPYKKFIIQLMIGLLLGSMLQLIFPFLTQAIVDKGISNQDFGFIHLILIAQLVLFCSQTSVNFIRSWILLHISTRINISIISDFLIKLLKLSIGFFDSKMIGDIMQRINDHRRIELFITSSTLNIIFSIFNLVIFGIVLVIYNLNIFFIFLLGSLIYILWVYIFMKKRRELDFKRFSQLADNQNNLFQMITGIQEIKLNNCEKQARWSWEKIQARLFRVNVKGLALEQYQQSGSMFVNQIKNILISFFSAKAVIEGNMTLGMMMSVQYIIGQLNSPIDQMIGFFQTAQDAKISFERLVEIHGQPDEELLAESKLNNLPNNKSIRISGLSFQYMGSNSELVLKDLNLEIPMGKVCAVVGVSGSGKTTLLKLLLGFYPPTRGEISVGNIPLPNISHHAWREKCGVVMQDGFIFSDSIENNIALGEEVIDNQKLLRAASTANVVEFIKSLPLGLKTKIGMEGHGLSQGQKQRILIARAVYKNPEYIFFDEATNALDAYNELQIMNNLQEFFQGKTVIVVAHRLSTVKNADQIVVIDKGKIVEKGTHQELAKLEGVYFNLVKNQLELGN